MNFEKILSLNQVKQVLFCKELAYNANELIQSVQVLGTEGSTLLKDVSSDIMESVSKWNEEMEPEKKRLKDEIKDMQKTISDLEKTLKKE